MLVVDPFQEMEPSKCGRDLPERSFNETTGYLENGWPTWTSLRPTKCLALFLFLATLSLFVSVKGTEVHSRSFFALMQFAAFKV